MKAGPVLQVSLELPRDDTVGPDRHAVLWASVSFNVKVLPHSSRLLAKLTPPAFPATRQEPVLSDKGRLWRSGTVELVVGTELP